MKKIYLPALLFGTVLVFGLFSCNSGAADEETNARLDSLKQDSTRKANFMANYNRYYNDVARFMAGLSQTEGSRLAKFDTLPETIEYQQSNKKFFDSFKENQTDKMEAFSNAELKDIRKDSMTLFYPFSGPDFINADPFFPEATTTVMFGLEPVGSLPHLSEEVTGEELRKIYKSFRRSIDSLAFFGYFMTNDMSRDLRQVAELNGNLSIITFFMAQRGYYILNVKKVTIDPNGTIVDSIPGRVDKDDPSDSYISGGLIEYMKPDEFRARKLYYFSHDVSDAKLAKTPEMLTFFKSLKIDVAFFKAASYLCSWLNSIREFTLENAKNIVQDDSGIPLKYFNDEIWNKTFYGKYRNLLNKQFQNAFFQSDLKAIYDKDTTIKQFDFKFGYNTRIKQDNIMVARRK